MPATVAVEVPVTGIAGLVGLTEGDVGALVGDLVGLAGDLVGLGDSVLADFVGFGDSVGFADSVCLDDSVGLAHGLAPPTLVTTSIALESTLHLACGSMSRSQPEDVVASGRAEAGDIAGPSPSTASNPAVAAADNLRSKASSKTARGDPIRRWDAPTVGNATCIRMA